MAEREPQHAAQNRRPGFSRPAELGVRGTAAPPEIRSGGGVGGLCFPRDRMMSFVGREGDDVRIVRVKLSNPSYGKQVMI